MIEWLIAKETVLIVIDARGGVWWTFFFFFFVQHFNLMHNNVVKKLNISMHQT